jgi:hypothetical protein
MIRTGKNLVAITMNKWPPLSRRMAIGFLLAGLAAFCGLGYMLYTAIQMTRAGRGLESYRTFWLVEFNWIGFLVLCGVGVVALLVAGMLRLREHRQWRSLERKYDGGKE